MRKYPQLSIVYPRATLSIAVIVMLSLAALVANHPLRDVEPLRDLVGVGAAVFLALVVIAGFVFRNAQAMVFTTLVMGIGALATGGVISASDVSAAMLFMVAVVFAMSLGVAYSMYVGYAYISEVLLERGNGRSLRDHRYILSEAVRKVRDRLLFTSAVLCIGFLSMLVSPVPGLARLGLFLAVDTAAVTLAALTVVPALIAWWPFSVKDTAQHNQLTGWLLGKASSSTTSRPKVHLSIAALVILACVAAGVGKILTGDGAFDPAATSMLYGLAIACVAIFVIMVFGFRSKALAISAFIGSCLPVVLVAGIIGLIARPLDPSVVVAGGIMLAISVANAMYLFTAFLGHRRYFTPSSPMATEQTLAEVGRPVLLSSLTLVPGFGIMAFSSHGAPVGMGIALCISAVAAMMVSLLVTPALLALAKVELPAPKQSDIDLLGKFKKLRADAPRKSFDDYNDEEILSMFTGDFLALSGKRVIRQGGMFGTRRLFYELDIKPGMKVLEIGTGVGASAFDIAEHYDVQVTSVDLSAYMVSVAKELARERGLEDRITIMHVTDGDHYPFEDNTFDLVLTESIVMYANPDSIFSETYRVLKPGGRIGFHDWSWPQKPNRQFEELTCIIACGCNLGDIQILSKAEWNTLMEKWDLRPRFSEEYPFKFFAFTGMRDDEGTLAVIKMFARVFKRRATIIRMMRMIWFLGRNDGAFSYSIIVGEKKNSLESGAVAEKKDLLKPGPSPRDAAILESKDLQTVDAHNPGV